MHAYDFWTREELYKLEDFPSRIQTVQPLFRDFSAGHNEGLFWITCADGSVSLFDAIYGKRTNALQQRGQSAHCMAPCSAVYYLKNTLQSSIDVTMAMP